MISVLDTGFCTARSSLIERGTGWRTVRCHAPAFLIHHPSHGPILFDTGYAPRLADAFARWPDRVYKYATPTTFGTPAVDHLAQFGYTARDIRTVIVSHLHADHVAGLPDFPDARFVISDTALRLQQSVRGLDAVRRGIVQALFPADFTERATVVSTFTGPTLPHLGHTHDLFADGTVLLVALPGHARGQLGALVHCEGESVLLCADGAWSTRAFRELRPPHWITNAMQDDLVALRSTLVGLREFSRARPDVTILPTHCRQTMTWESRR